MAPVLRQQVYLDHDGAEIGVSLRLPEPGDWASDFVDMELVDVFNNDSVLGVNPFVEYLVGFRCGDPFALDVSSTDGNSCNGPPSWRLAPPQ